MDVAKGTKYEFYQLGTNKTMGYKCLYCIKDKYGSTSPDSRVANKEALTIIFKRNKQIKQDIILIFSRVFIFKSNEDIIWE